MGENRTKKKYQIFISSTYEDLKEERKKVSDAILSMMHFPVGMELFGATSDDQWNIIEQTIETSDYYILIVAQRYGSIIKNAEDEEISFTEKEFDYAIAHGVPVLAFIKDDNALINPNTLDKEDSEIKKYKLRTFKEKIRNGRTVETWSSPEDLALKVTSSIYKEIGRTERPGWIRGDSIDVGECLNQITELSKKVRTLESENNLLKGQNNRKPIIDLEVGYAGTLGREILRNVQFDSHIEINKLFSDDEPYIEVPCRLEDKDIPDDLRGVIKNSDIKKYNSQIDKIEEYINEVKYYEEIRETCVFLNFKINNNGTLKAKDINITLRFPKELYLQKRKDIKDIKKPNKPSIPLNPIEHPEMYRLEDMTNLVLGGNNIENGIQKSRRYIPEILLNNDLPVPGWDFSLDQENNCVEIWINEMLHGMEKISDELCICPIENGNYVIEATIICEEYEQPIEKEISIQVNSIS